MSTTITIAAPRIVERIEVEGRIERPAAVALGLAVELPDAAGPFAADGLEAVSGRVARASGPLAELEVAEPARNAAPGARAGIGGEQERHAGADRGREGDGGDAARRGAGSSSAGSIQG